MRKDSMAVRVGAIGMGWVALNRHLPVMNASSELEVVGVADTRDGVARAIAAKNGYDRYCEDESLSREQDVTAIPWLDEVEAISLATPAFSHYGLITSALNAGKHVLTEKPFTMALDEGEALVKLAHAKHLTLGIVHNFQFMRSARRLMADITSGLYGRIRSVAAYQLGNPKRRLPDWYEELPLGLFYDESPHLFYLLARLSPGPLTSLRVDMFPSTEGRNTPALVDALYRCDVDGGGRIPVRLLLNFESPLSEWHVQVLGDRFFGDVDVFRDIYIRLPNDGSHTAKTIVRTSLHATWQHWIQHIPSGIKHFRGCMWYGNPEVFHRFAAAVRCGDQPKDMGPEDALETLRMQHEVLGQHRNLLGASK